MRKSMIYLLAVTYALIIGFSFLFTKMALNVSDPIDMLAYRFTISFAAVFIPVMAGWIKLGLRGKDFWRLLPIGLIYPTMFFGFQAFGLMDQTSSEGGIFQASAPIMTMVLAAIFLKERTTWLQKLSVLCSVFGIIYILFMKGATLDGSNLKGILLLLLSALALAFYSVFARSMRNDFTAMQMTFVMMLIGFISFSSMTIVKYAQSGKWNELVGPLSQPHFVLSLLYVGIMSSLVSSLLSNYVLSKLEASQMSVFVNLATLISILAGVIFLGERLAYYHIVGAVLIITGVLGTNFQMRKRRNVTRGAELYRGAVK